MDESIRFAKQYLEDMLSFFGLNTDVHATADEDVIELSVPSTHLNGFLIGQRGDTLRSLQFLVSVALKNNGHEYTRVNVDIADYKRHRQDRLAAQARDWIAEVKRTGEPMHLQPMNAADRRVIHRLVGEIGGVASESEGEGRDRHIVLKKTDDASYDEPAEDTEPVETNSVPEAEELESQEE